MPLGSDPVAGEASSQSTEASAYPPLKGIEAGQAEAITNQDQVQSSPRNYLEAGKSALIGGAKGAASLLDAFTQNNTNSNIDLYPGNEDTKQQIKSQPQIKARDVADKYLPEAKNKSASNIGEATAYGAPFGLPGMAISAATAAGTEALNAVDSEHPVRNAVIPAVASAAFTPGAINQLVKLGRPTLEGLGVVSRTPLVQAKLDQGITTGTAASTTPSDFWRKLQRSIRESLIGGGKINKNQEIEQQQLSTAVNRQADTLGPDVTKQTAGQGLQTDIPDGVQQAKKLFADREAALDQVMPPDHTYVNMQPYIDKLQTAFTPPPGATNQTAAMGLNPLDTHLKPLMEDLAAVSGGFQNTALPVEAIRYVKQRVGDKLEASLLNGDAASRDLKVAYGMLADAQGSAYAGTPYERYYIELKNAEKEFYTSVEAFAEPLVKQGLTPERVSQMLMSDMRLGDSRISAVLDLITPGMRDQYSSMILRNVGKDLNGNFSPERFFNNWSRISPEAKVTLFSDANKDIPAAYDQLALLAQNQARGARATNPPQTAGTMEVFNLLDRFGKAIGGLAGMGAGHALATKGNVNQVADNEAGALGIGGASGYLAGSLLMSTAGFSGMARLMTNPTFIRWLATPVAFDQVPMHVRALSAIAGEVPEIKDNINTFQNFANQTLHIHAQGKPFLGGGYAGFPQQNPNDYAKGGHVTHNSPYNPFADDSSSYAEGGPIEDRDYIEPPSKDNSNTPFEAPKAAVKLHKSLYQQLLEPQSVDTIEPSGQQLKAHYAAGGPTEINENEKQGSNILDYFLGQHKPLGGGGLGGPRVTPEQQENNSFLEQLFGPDYAHIFNSGTPNEGAVVNPNTKRGVQWDFTLPGWSGKPFTDNANDNAFAQGGTFYNPDPSVNNTDIQGGGWAEGGPTWEMQHNNFGGIRKAGVNATPTKGGFMSYNTPEDSLKDISRLLDVYQDKHGLNTLSGIINRWAPPNENDTKLLINRASQWTGFGANTPIDVHNPEVKAKLIAATIMNEQGGKLPVSHELIQKIANSPNKLEINKYNNSAVNITPNNNKQQTGSLLSQLIPNTQETSDDTPEELFKDTKAAINTNPAFESATKFAANKILSENS